MVVASPADSSELPVYSPASVLAEHGSELAVYPAFYGIVRGWETSDDFSVTVHVRFQEREHFPAFR